MNPRTINPKIPILEVLLNTLLVLIIYCLINLIFAYRDKRLKENHLSLPGGITLLLIFLMTPQQNEEPVPYDPIWREIIEPFQNETIKSNHAQKTTRKRKPVEILQNQAKKRKYNTGEKRKNHSQNENNSGKKKQKTGIIMSKSLGKSGDTKKL